MAVSTLIVMLIVGFDHSRQTISVHLKEKSFSIRKFSQLPVSYSYEQIVNYSQRKRKEKTNGWLEFNVYLENGDWFCINSNQFKSYESLKISFSQYGEHRYLPQPNFYDNILTLFVVHWLSFICLVGIFAGYAAHDEVEANKATLVPIRSAVQKVELHYTKQGFTGVTLQLTEYPKFDFYANDDDYAVSLKFSAESMHTGQIVTLRIRKSEFEKKISRTRLPSFGDKYSRFNRISVFDIDSITAKMPIYEDAHTWPNLRALFYIFVLLFCFPAWVK